MKQIAQIENNEIINVFVMEDDFQIPANKSAQFMLIEDAISQNINYKNTEPSLVKPDAPAWKVKIWLLRSGIDPDVQIPAIISQAIPEGPERTEALIRWRDVPVVPFNHHLVTVVASGLNLDPAVVWDEILSI
jgi:hypothetical protein